MSQYFSRLATRSGVATTSRALQPRPTRSDEASSWSEQSTEVIAQPSTSAADSNANFDSPITHSVGIHKENISVNTVLEMPETHRRISANSIAVSEPSDITPSITASDFHSPLNTARSLPGSTALTDEIPITSDHVASSAYTTKNDVGEPRTLDSKTTKQIAKNKTVGMTRPQTESTADDKPGNKPSTAAPPFEDINIIKSRTAHSSARGISEVEPDKSAPSFHQNNQIQTIARVASQPAQVAAAKGIASHSSSRSSVQVNIGKIELEIHAPAKSAMRAPQPIRSSTAPAKTPAKNTAFNPHRHYLRSR